MAMQDFLASYSVQVDEDGARRLQAILDENRASGEQLAGVFSAAQTALASLKKELSESSGLQNLFAALSGSAGGFGNSARLPASGSASGGGSSPAA